MQKSWYAVAVGRRPGVYAAWSDAKTQIRGFSGGTVKKFTTRSEAQGFVDAHSHKAIVDQLDPEQSDSDCYSLYTDGASRGNPGEAAAGAVLLSPDGREVATDSQYLGRRTNNWAEYEALRLGLALALAHGVTNVRVHCDSELIVRQVNGLYKVSRPDLADALARVKVLSRRFARITVVHVLRALNKRADELANQALDSRGASTA